MAEDQNRSMQDKFMLRLPDGMREQLKSQAQKSGRSLNSEIVHRLANSLSFPRFADAGFDFGLGFDEDLNFNLMSSANVSGRTLTQEIVFRLEQSLRPEQDVIYDLERQTWAAKRDLDRMMRLFIQMTPEERRVLEERAEICERASDWSISSNEIRKHTDLFRIGGHGRQILTKAPADYSHLIKKEPGDDIDLSKPMTTEATLDDAPFGTDGGLDEELGPEGRED